MKVQRPESPIIIESPLSDKASNVEPSGASTNYLKKLITQRSEDFLMRMIAHGTSQQQYLAKSTYEALATGLFIPNPNTDLRPVQQFGMASTLYDKKGVMLANLMPLGNELDLVAIGFREEKYFNHETGPVIIIPLEHAKDLEEVQVSTRLADKPSRGESGMEASLPKPEEGRSLSSGKKPDSAPTLPTPKPTQPPAAETAKAKQSGGGLRATEIGPIEMQRLMAHQLVDEKIKEKREQGKEVKKTKWTVAGAHVDLMIRQAAKFGSKYVPGHSVAKKPAIASEKMIPKGLQYEFPKESFEVFHDYLVGREDFLDNLPLEKNSSASASKLGEKAPARRYGLTNQNAFEELLKKKLDENNSTKSVNPNIEKRQASTGSLDGISQVSSSDGSKDPLLREVKEFMNSMPAELRKTLAESDEEGLRPMLLERTTSNS